MSMTQRDGSMGRDDDDPMALCERARPHAKPITNSLPPCDQNSRKAVDVLWLLHWAFVREKVHLARPQGMDGVFCRPPMGYADSTLSVGSGGSGSGYFGFKAPADAYAVLRAVEALGLPGKLVREYAMIGLGARPDWTPEPVITVERGKTGHAWHLTNRGKKSVSAPFRLFKYRGDLPEIVEQRRMIYTVWANAVASLHDGLTVQGKLVAHELTADLPPARPWGSSGS